MSEKTWRRGLDVRFADEGGEVSFKINYLKGGAVVVTQVVLAAVYLKIAAEHGSECEPASAYINASGILFCFGAISSLASFAHFHSRSVSDQTTTSWRVPFLAAYLSGKPTLNQEEREFNGGVLTFFLAVVGIGCQAFAAATTVDMTLLLFSLLEAKQCFTGDDKNPGGPTTVSSTLLREWFVDSSTQKFSRCFSCLESQQRSASQPLWLFSCTSSSLCEENA